jgi:mycothiol system anti-sigma-R factor
MTDCGCEKAKAELEEFLHNELCASDVAEVQEHLETCADCRSELEVGRTLTEVVQRACKESAPDHLRELIMLKLRGAQTAR